MIFAQLVDHDACYFRRERASASEAAKGHSKTFSILG